MRIGTFHQTAFVTKDNRVKCHICVLDWDGCNPYFLSATVNDKQVLERVPNWDAEMDFYLPAVEEESVLILELFPFQDNGVEKRCRYLPPKLWSVDFFLSSHEDLGYCAYANTLASECADYLDAAVELAERDPGYDYVIEHYWWLRGYEEYRDDEAKERLKRLMQQGRIELSAPHCSNHTHWQGGANSWFGPCIMPAKRGRRPGALRPGRSSMRTSQGRAGRASAPMPMQAFAIYAYWPIAICVFPRMTRGFPGCSGGRRRTGRIAFCAFCRRDTRNFLFPMRWGPLLLRPREALTFLTKAGWMRRWGLSMR